MDTSGNTGQCSLHCPIMNIIGTRTEDISWEMEKYRLQYLISETLDLDNQGTITVHCF